MHIEKVNNGIGKVTFKLCDDLIDKSGKYYISFRILNRCGFYFQAINCLLFSLESFFKLLYLLERETFTQEELKTHDLKKLAEEIKLEKEEFPNIYKILNAYKYTEIRYNHDLLINEVNYRDKHGNWIYLEAISLEISKLHKVITEKIQNKFPNSSNFNAGLYNGWKYSRQPQQIKEFIEDSLSKGDENFMNVDYT